jgi:hypothetical protein
MYNFWLNSTDYNDTKSIYGPAAYFASHIPRLNLEGGIQGYFYVWSHGLLGNFMIPNKFANASKINAMLDPILDKMSKMPGISQKSLIKLPPVDTGSTGGLAALLGGAPKTGSPVPILNPSLSVSIPDGENRLTRRHGPDGAMMTYGMGLFDLDSRLLGEEELKNPKLADALEKAQYPMLDGHLRLHITAGGKVLQPNNNTSVLPAWRKAFVHLTTAGQEVGNIGSMRDLAPNTGAYVNEVS